MTSLWFITCIESYFVNVREIFSNLSQSLEDSGRASISMLRLSRYSFQFLEVLMFINTRYLSTHGSTWISTSIRKYASIDLRWRMECPTFCCKWIEYDASNITLIIQSNVYLIWDIHCSVTSWKYTTSICQLPRWPLVHWIRYGSRPFLVFEFTSLTLQIQWTK